MARPDDSPASVPLPAGLVGAVGATLLAVVGWHLVATHVPVMLAETDPVRFALELVEALLLVGPPVALVAVGYRMAADGVRREHGWLVLEWVLVGVVGVVGVIAAIEIHRVLLDYVVHDSLVEMEVRTGGGVGGLLGAVVGWSRVERQRQATQLRRQRDAFLFLNRLLRHQVLNSTQVIDGYAARVADRLDGEDRALCDPIRRRSRTVTALVENVRIVARTFTEAPRLEPVALDDLVRAEIEAARRVHEDATFVADLADDVRVRSNDLLAVAVEHLLDNAVRHNDAEAPRVRVTVDGDDRVGRVRVADEGPGVPDDEKRRFTAPGETGDRGLGLYLADRVATQHGGQLRIDDNDPRGTVVTIELPVANAGGDPRPTT
ncbi:MAG: sensor histidine kinase [Haloferacaceae archaeon]